jgi:two-component system sensor histidine kinase PilS (NtrC family)
MLASKTLETAMIAPVTDGYLGESLWRSLRYFGVYRVAAAAVFLAVFLVTGGTSNLASQDPSLFVWTDAVYLALAVAFLFGMWRFERWFDLQLSVQVACDVAALTLLMFASGGARSGFAIMLVVVVAGAALVGQGRLTLFYAALATLALLVEQAWRTIHYHAEAEDFLRVGLTSIGFFATALIIRFLARRVIANESLARQRGFELADQVRINRQVIHDMENGVLVVDGEGRVRLHNPSAEALLDVRLPANAELADYSSALVEHVGRRRSRPEASDMLRLSVNGKSLQVRLLAPEADGNTLIYLQDLELVQAEARQIKLAALGRLTANIAHEIRNPLAAISHAAELLVEEQRAEARQRLVRIIVDNSGRLNRLVGEVLELGRRDRAMPETIAIADFLRHFIDEYALHDADIRQRVGVMANEGDQVCFDRSHLHRVLENLVTNALCYASRSERAVELGAAMTAPGRLELHVVDDGPGIAGDERSKVFEPFFTTRGGGTGLGLYIARELCEANDARLDLVDADRGGAHFRIIAKGGPCPQSSIAAIEAT